LDFQFIHIYSDASIDAKTIGKEISKIFPSCKVDIRPSIMYGDGIEQAKIADTKQPFERQPEQKETIMPLYDGFVLQRMLLEVIAAAEADHVHIMFTGLLVCTFSEDDWHYHARTVVCGTPSIISMSGIVEGPAKPKEFYIEQLGGMPGMNLKRRFAGRFVEYGDHRMTAAAAVYALQALFFFVVDGEPFCGDKSCRLYNAHWQEELIHVIERGAFCARHERIANKFNNKRSGGKRF
jgi:hypothetical protein